MRLKRGVHPQIFIPALQILVIWVLSIQKIISLYIYIYMVGVNEGPT